MFALDVEKDASWCSWQPGVTEGSGSDVDTAQVDMAHRENSLVGRVCGHLWLDLDMLISMCSNKTGPGSVSPGRVYGAVTPGLAYILEHCTISLC